MEDVLLALVLPLVVFALIWMFGRRRPTAAAAAIVVCRVEELNAPRRYAISSLPVSPSAPEYWEKRLG